MAQNIHFEIFRRRGNGGSWSLVEVRDGRDEALAFAQALITGDQVGVRVMKETYNESTGDYLSLKIFEHGEQKVKSKLVEDNVPDAPCFKVDDLYSYHARKTIAQLLPDFLSRHKVTVTELSHRADLLEKLEATGTLLQHAIQRVAVAQAATGENQLTKIIRSLHDLTTQAMHRVYRDHDKKRFVAAEPGGFLPLAEKHATAGGDGLYLLNGSLALYLKEAQGWDDKVARLLTLMEEAQGDTPGAKLLFGCIDTLISETLNGPAGLRELIGAQDNHGKALMALVKLYLGREPDEVEGRAGLIALTRQFARDTLPNARTAIAQRILAEIKSFKRLCPNSLEEEFRALRQIANLVVTGISKYLSHEDLIGAFTLRSQRLVNFEALSPYLAGITPDEKLDRILFVEENIIGAENKRRLADFVPPVLTAPAFEEYFQNPKLPALQRLQRLQSFQERVRRSGFQDNHRKEISDGIDKIAAAVEAKNRILDSIDKRPISPSEKVALILKLVAAKTFTTPRVTERVKHVVAANIAKPGFLTGYVAQVQDRETAMSELIKSLAAIGISGQAGLKLIAA